MEVLTSKEFINSVISLDKFASVNNALKEYLDKEVPTKIWLKWKKQILNSEKKLIVTKGERLKNIDLYRKQFGRFWW